MPTVHQQPVAAAATAAVATAAVAKAAVAAAAVAAGLVYERIVILFTFHACVINAPRIVHARSRVKSNDVCSSVHVSAC